MSALMTHARTSQLVIVHFLLNAIIATESTGALFATVPSRVGGFLLYPSSKP